MRATAGVRGLGAVSARWSALACLAIGLSGCATSASTYREEDVAGDAGFAAGMREEGRVEIDDDYQCGDAATQRVGATDMKKLIDAWRGGAGPYGEMAGYRPQQRTFTSPQAAYPNGALHRDLAGAARVLIFTDASGAVARTLVVCATDDVFTSAAIATVKGNQYSPTTLDGVAVRDVAFQKVVYFTAMSK